MHLGYWDTYNRTCHGSLLYIALFICARFICAQRTEYNKNILSYSIYICVYSLFLLDFGMCV